MHETIWRLFFRENVTKITENASLQWDPHSKVTSPGGEHGRNKNISREKYNFFEHETKTKKIDRSILSIGSSRYVAQFLDHLEHSGYAILRGKKNLQKISVARPNFTMGIPIVSCRRLPGSGSRFDDFP